MHRFCEISTEKYEDTGLIVFITEVVNAGSYIHSQTETRIEQPRGVQATPLGVAILRNIYYVLNELMFLSIMYVCLVDLVNSLNCISFQT